MEPEVHKSFSLLRSGRKCPVLWSLLVVLITCMDEILQSVPGDSLNRRLIFN